MPTSRRALPAASAAVVSTGIAGLDQVMQGGWPRRRMFLVRGRPGTGKTTMAMQFLLDGRRRGESGLYVTLSETKEELELVAASHEWSLEGLTLIELSALDQRLRPESQSTLLHPAEFELQNTIRWLESEITRLRPKRLVLDSLAELRLMAQSSLRYRRQMLALKTTLAAHDCTVLLLDDGSTEAGDPQIESIAHGVLDLEHLRQEYGAERRRLGVLKLRGVRFRGGFHDFTIRTGGLVVYPRLVAAEHGGDFTPGNLGTGLDSMDALLGGGLARGTSTLLLGPAGCGKSSLALQFAVAALGRGQKAALFLFDELAATMRTRAAGLDLRIDDSIRDGRLHVRQVDPAELAPGEFALVVRELVERDGVEVVVIDSLNGLLAAMPDERFLMLQLHELLMYLAQRGIVTILVLAQHGLVGSSMGSPVDLTYLADTVVLLRFFEFGGAMKKAVSVVKKRSGRHEDTIREYELVDGVGIRVGEPLTHFRGVMTGLPSYVGRSDGLLATDDERRD
jgi:circadian clock protein KaiC